MSLSTLDHDQDCGPADILLCVTETVAGIKCNELLQAISMAVDRLNANVLEKVQVSETLVVSLTLMQQTGQEQFKCFYITLVANFIKGKK